MKIQIPQLSQSYGSCCTDNQCGKYIGRMESICDFLGIEHEPMGDVEEQIGGAIEQDDWHPRQEEIFEVAMECSDPKGDDMKAALKTAKKQFPIRIR